MLYDIDDTYEMDCYDLDHDGEPTCYKNLLLRTQIFESGDYFITIRIKDVGVWRELISEIQFDVKAQSIEFMLYAIMTRFWLFLFSIFLVIYYET